MLELVDWTLSSSATEVSKFSEPLFEQSPTHSGILLSHFSPLSTRWCDLYVTYLLRNCKQTSEYAHRRMYICGRRGCHKYTDLETLVRHWKKLNSTYLHRNGAKGGGHIKTRRLKDSLQYPGMFKVNRLTTNLATSC